MSSEREIELDVDAVFPPPGARSGMVRRPDVDSTPPMRALPPPPAIPEAVRVLEQIQEDVDLVIEATSRRLDDTSRRVEEFERTVRGVLGAQERRMRELETQLYESQRRIAELSLDLDRQAERAHELHARNAVAMARVEALERAGASRAGADSDDFDGSESTQKILHT